MDCGAHISLRCPHDLNACNRPGMFEERFQIDAFLFKTVNELVWTEGLNASKCMRFQTKTH